MNRIEKYGVLTLIFVIVLILMVAVWNGPDGGGAPPASNDSVAEGRQPAAPPGGENRAAIESFLAQQERARDEAARRVVPGGIPQGPGIVAAPAFKEYVIQKGDVLGSIAKRELGSSTLWPEIVKANEGLDPKRLRPGSTIMIPVLDRRSPIDSTLMARNDASR